MPVSICDFVDCRGVLPKLRTTESLTPVLSTFPDDIGESGDPFIVYLAEYPDTCWRVIKADLPPVTPLPYVVLNDFTECITCINAIPPVVNVYILEDCLEVANPIYSFTSTLADAVGQVVKLEGSELCWGVSTVVFDEQTITDVVIATNVADVPQIFDDCECCLPTPEPAPIKYTRVIPKPDRKFYQIKESQCDIKGNVRFAEGYYRLFKKLKYGIDSACDNINLDKLWIKKNLSDLAMINDPTACIITKPVSPVICPEPQGQPFIPPLPPTYIFTVGEPGVGTGTFGCTTCLDGNPPAGGILCPAFNMILDYNILDTIDIDAVYVFSNASGCVITLGSFISEGATEGFATYTMTEANIVNAGIEPAEPCASCPS